MKTFEFAHGNMPAIGLGTWQLDDGTATEAVKTALRMGYHHIDCAAIYLNEPEVGVAFGDVFSSGEIDREDVWVTSKLWCNRHQPDLVKRALEKTLADLQLDYLDLYMIHWPIAFRPDVHRPEGPDDFVSLDQMPLIDTWRALESCLDAGLCRNIGVCNFSIKKLQTILDGCKIKPSANQVESHPLLPQEKLFEFCRNENIQPVAYSPLGSGGRPERMRDGDDPSVLENDVIKKIAADCDVQPGQVALVWAVNRGTVAIPKSGNPVRQQQNLDAGTIELTAQQMAEIDAIETRHRYVQGRFWEMEGAPYTVANIWDE